MAGLNPKGLYQLKWLYGSLKLWTAPSFWPKYVEYLSMAQAAEATMKGSTEALLLSRHSPAQLMATSRAEGVLAGKSHPWLQHVLYPEISWNKTNSATPLTIKFAFQLRMWWCITKIFFREICFQLSAWFSVEKMSLSNKHVFPDYSTLFCAISLPV